MLFLSGKVFGKFAELINNVSLHLVEVSPALSEIQESTLTGGSHNDNKKQKQSGETRIMAFENEVLSGDDTACMQCYIVSLVADTCTCWCVISSKVRITDMNTTHLSGQAIWDYSTVNHVCFSAGTH